MTADADGTYGYLGPAGTFAEAALLHWLAEQPSRAKPRAFASVLGALEAVHSGEIQGAMVPLENSIEGSVSATLDALATGPELSILAEEQVDVTFSLLAPKGVALADVAVVTTHPHAEAQCRPWLAENLPDAQYTVAPSTAAAAATVAADSDRPDAKKNSAAIAAPLAGQVYGLTELAANIAGSVAQTRFVLVTRPAAPPAATGADKTTVVLFMGEDHPGALLEILSEFAVRGVNLSRIESRPTGGGLGDYFFSVDIEGHIDDARVGEALMGLRRVCAAVRYLGSYPRLDQMAPRLRPGVSDEEFRDAQAWLTRIREGRP